MADLHPELARLLERYQRLVADAAAGAVSGQDAYGLLSQLSVTDASGAVWGIDDEGTFVRRRNPNEAPERVPPGLFAASVIPQQLHTPPKQSHSMPAPQLAPVQMPSVAQQPLTRPAQWATQSEQSGVMMPDSNMLDPRASYDQPAQQMGMNGQSDLSQNSGADFVRHRSDSRPSFKDVTKARLEGRGATIAVFCAIGFALILGAATRGDMPSPTASASTTIAGAPDVADVATTVAAPIATPPSEADVTRIFAALIVGDLSVLADAGASDSTGTQRAAWMAYGLYDTALRGDPAAANGDVQLQLVSVTRPDNTVVASYRARWVMQAGVWTLAEWPERLS